MSELHNPDQAKFVALPRRPRLGRPRRRTPVAHSHSGRRRTHRREPATEGFTAEDIVVHQQDVENVVNALWAAGAEAMMLMDQRVISTSAVRCVGEHI